MNTLTTIKYIFVFFMQWVLFSSALWAAELSLTPQEQQWLQAHPVIKVSNEEDWAPYDFAVNGQAKGYSVDIVKRLARAIGLKVEFVNGYSWSELVEEFDKGHIDLMHSMSWSEERNKKYLLSKSSIPWSLSYIIRKNESSIKSPKDFRGKKIAIGRGWATTPIIKKLYPEAIFIEFDSSLKMLQELSTGKVDVSIDNVQTAHYLMSENLITNLVHGGYLNIKAYGVDRLHFASHKNSPELVSMFDKAYENMTTQEKLTLQKKWFSNLKLSEILFTDEERDWMRENPVVMIGGEMDWAPFDYVDRHGNYQGIIKDYLALFEQKSNLVFKVKTAQTWEQLLGLFEAGEVDILPAVYDLTTVYKKMAYGTEPYIKLTNMLYVRENETRITSYQKLAHARVAIIKGYEAMAIAKPYPENIEIVEVNSLKEAVYDLLDHKVDAFIDSQFMVEHFLKENLITGIKSISLPEFVEESHLHMLVNKSKPQLYSIMEKLIASVNEDEKYAILAKWTGTRSSSQYQSTLELSKKEKEYLKQKERILMCIDPDWMPFEKFDENGKHIGITADFFELFRKDIGISIEPVPTKTWLESLQAVKTGKCDILSLAMETRDRRKYLNFTSPYISMALVIVTRSDVAFFNDLHFLNNKKVGVIKGYAFSEILKTKYPDIKIVEVNDSKEALDKVARGELFGFIETVISLAYLLQTEYAGELKVSGKFDEKLELGVGVSKNDPVLLTIFEKAIKNLSPEIKQQILSKYLVVKYEKTIDYSLLLKIIVAGGVLFLIVFYHNRKLSKMNVELETLQAELKEQAHRDPLTHLYNRRYFHDVATDIVNLSKRETKEVSVIIIDIDKFKAINDTYGHQVGDSVIKNLSSLLLENIRGSDVVARFGGEEFVILLPNTDLDGAFTMAENLRKEVQKTRMKVKDKEIRFTISIGVDKVDRKDKSIDAALGRADRALYKAKENGRNQTVVFQG